MGNVLSVYNTRLVAAYLRVDPRMRPLVMLVKCWAKRRIINDAGRETISRYCQT